MGMDTGLVEHTAPKPLPRKSGELVWFCTRLNCIRSGKHGGLRLSALGYCLRSSGALAVSLCGVLGGQKNRSKSVSLHSGV